MVIAVNTGFHLNDGPEVSGYFIFECFSRLAKKYPQHQFIYIFDRAFDKKWASSGNITTVITSPVAKSSLLWQYWYNYKLPSLLQKYKATIFVSTDGICSLRTKVPQCLVLQDLAFLLSPGFISKNHLRFYKKFTGRFLAKSKAIVTVSAFSKKTIVEKYKIDAQKINVIYPGTNEMFKPIGEAAKKMAKDKYADGKEYFLFTGDLELSNNLMNLLKAFSFFKKRQKSNMLLLIAATNDGKYNQFSKDLGTFKFRNEVKLLSGLSTTALINITGAAYAFVYPVLFTNFAQHPLEAMQCNVPVITSYCCAIPELCAATVLYINPEEYTDIADKMMLVFKDENRRNELIKAAATHVKQYHWNKTADQLWQLICNTIQQETT